MATTNKGRGGSRTRSTGSPFSVSGNFVGFTGRTNRSGFGSAATSKRGTSRKTGGTITAGGYKNVCNTLQSKINSFKTLVNQTKGPAKGARPSPSTINSFANWINKGNIIQTCSPAQVARWAKNTKKNFSTRNPSTTACKNVLCAKFGKSTIKAVARTKSGQFMVVTSPTCKGKSFSFPK